MTQFTVTPNFHGKTVREFFAQNGFSTTQIKRWKFHGKILVNGQPQTVACVLKTGDLLQLVSPTRLKTPSFAQQAAKVLFADSYLYVTYKPYGVAIHPDRAHKNDTLGNMLATHFGDGFELRIVTRLDKTTSGLVLGALDEISAMRLNEMQQNHQIEKTYFAETEGVFEQQKGVVDLPLLRLDEQNKTVVSENGKSAQTLFEVVEIRQQTTTVSVQPKTGRTHQIRAHLAAVGHSIVGDTLYGAKPADRIRLQCVRLQFVHPVTHQKIDVSCDAEF